MPAFPMNEFVALASIHFLAVVAPGPDFAVTVSQSVRYGRSVGFYTALGIGVGISVHVLYTVLGIGALMHASSLFMTLAKLSGAAYLIYLAIQLIRAKARKGDIDLDNSSSEVPSKFKSFSRGFFTNATNPKATLFFLAIFTTMVSATTPLAIQALYGAWMCFVNAAWFSVVSFCFSNSTVRQSFLRLGHWFERLMGLVMGAFAVRLLFSL